MMTLDVQVLAESIRTSPTHEAWIDMLKGLRAQEKSSEKTRQLEFVIEVLIRTKRRAYLEIALELQYGLVREAGTPDCNQPADVRLHLHLLRLLAATKNIGDAKVELLMLKSLTERLGLGREALRKIIEQFPDLQR
jgi:hypothetical protein